jgi:hypothetical protein
VEDKRSKQKRAREAIEYATLLMESVQSAKRMQPLAGSLYVHIWKLQSPSAGHLPVNGSLRSRVRQPRDPSLRTTRLARSCRCRGIKANPLRRTTWNSRLPLRNCAMVPLLTHPSSNWA